MSSWPAVPASEAKAVAAARDEAAKPVKLDWDPYLVHLRAGGLARHLAAFAMAQPREEATRKARGREEVMIGKAQRGEKVTLWSAAW